MSAVAQILSPKYSAWEVAPGADSVAHAPMLFNSKVVVPLNTVTNASGNKNVLVYRADRVRVTSDTGAAWVPGDKVYLKADLSAFTKTSTSNTLCGTVADPKASGDTQGIIDLDPAQA